MESIEWLVPIEKEYPFLEKEYQRLELMKKSNIKAKTETYNSIRTHWLDKWNDFRLANWLDILGFPEPTLRYIICLRFHLE